MKQLKTITDEGPNVTSFQYDALGNRTQVTDGNGQIVEFDYDELDRLTHVTQKKEAVGSGLTALPDDLVTVFAYDPMGNVTSVTDPKSQMTTYGYDELSRLRTVTQPSGGLAEVGYDYDDRGRLTKVTNARDHALRYFYFPWGGLEKLLYDLNNNYDSAGEDGDRAISYAYDLNGNLRSTVDSDNATSAAANGSEELAGRLYTFTYDELNRVEAVTAHYISSDPVLTSGFDAFGNRTSLTLAQGSESLIHGWGFNPLNQLENMTLPGDSSPAISFTYLDDDSLDRITHGNGATTDVDYTVEGAIESITVEKATQEELHKLVYTYDGVLNVDTIQEFVEGNELHPTTDPMDTDPAYDYGYDAVYRLVSAVYPANPNPASESFPYDAAGNRDDDPDPMETSPWSYDANNRIDKSPGSGAADIDYDFDDDGNLTSRDDNGHTWALTWDATNRLEQVVDSGSGTTTYKYDPFGRRIEKVSGGSTTRYLWDGDRLLAEYDGSGVRQRRYAYAGGFAPIQVVEGAGGQCSDMLDNDGDDNTDLSDPDCTSATDPTEGTELDVHTDHLDTPRMLTNSLETPVWRANYEAFGRASIDEDPDGNSVPTTFNIRFPGQYHDEETGLHYNRFRYYDPENGRYISAEPIGQWGSFNVYRYANNNPLRWVDFLGLEPLDANGAAATFFQQGGEASKKAGSNPRARDVAAQTCRQGLNACVLERGDDSVELPHCRVHEAACNRGEDFSNESCPDQPPEADPEPEPEPDPLEEIDRLLREIREYDEE